MCDVDHIVGVLKEGCFEGAFYLIYKQYLKGKGMRNETGGGKVWYTRVRGRVRA